MNSSPNFARTVRDRSGARAIARSVPEPLFSSRRRQALCVGFLLIWPAFYAMRAHGATEQKVATVAPQTMRIGKSATFPLASGAKWFIEEGAANARVESEGDSLSIRGVSQGYLRVRIENGKDVQHMAFRFVMPDLIGMPIQRPSGAPTPMPVAADSPETQQLVSRQAQSQIAPANNGTDPLSAIPPIPANLSGAPIAAPASGSATPGVNPATAPAGFPNGGARVNPPAGFPTGAAKLNPPAGFPNGVPNLAPTLPAPANSGILTSPSDTGTQPLPELPQVSANGARTGTGSSTPRPTAAPVRPTTRPTAPKAATTPTLSEAPTGPQVVRPLPPASASAVPSSGASRPPHISGSFPPPPRTTRPDVPYRTTPRLPNNVSMKGAHPGIQVTQGLARLVQFPDNILSVFFSNPNVMDARAINARTIAVTGTGVGESTLAVFTSRYPGDAVGRANIYRVQGLTANGSAQAPVRDPQAVQAAITEALGDPRVRVAVVRVPDGTFAARLSGTVRNSAEVEGATTIAGFFVPRVVSSLYADATAPTVEAIMSGSANVTPEATLQDNLRRVTGNQSIELVSLPNGLVLKAEADSAEDAEAILRVLPSLGQPVTPFIVVHGQSSTQNPYYTSQALQGEDRALTERLQAVTGVTTVTAVRAATNSVAIYGTVQNRGDYEAVKRYGAILGQTTAGTLRPSGAEGALPAYDPAGGYLRPLGVQMFVRILDPAQAVVRNVTVETSVVEISRTALQNLGTQFGSATTTNETINNGVTTRTVSPTFNTGTIVAGNGFGGTGGLGFIDPFRAQLSALEQRGDARILSRPNVRAVEGMPAQITIGGERPVPSAVATTGATAQSVDFRRYGVIISMRPTVSDDNTIFLQIRADITQPDTTFQINLNGALIPGETVRSVDTSIAVRPGDVIIMGGLITNEKRQQTTKVPVLGDIPIIGSLFKSKRFENNETELAIFLQPRIEALPATPATTSIVERGPSFPTLPSRQESGGIPFVSGGGGGGGTP